jgi:hypothetical protein
LSVGCKDLRVEGKRTDRKNQEIKLAESIKKLNTLFKLNKHYGVVHNEKQVPEFYEKWSYARRE